MADNEVLLNFENADNFTVSELLGGLIELGKRDKYNEHNLAEHPWVAPQIAKLKVL